ncbi:MAG: DEAD/DEAH box helicase [Bacillota bacterium]
MPDKATQTVFPEAFAALGVRPSILRALGEAGFTTPTDIQALLIPRALAGVDLLGQARTGTGKTAAFTIPILQKCQRDGATQALILLPTRELAVQVDTEIKRLSKHTPIRSMAVYGGQKIAAQAKQLKFCPQIVVGTPGRVIDLLDRHLLNFNNIHFIVLDEVDRMLDIGFRDDIRNILGRIKDKPRSHDSDAAAQPAATEPAANHHPQTIFVSATISEEVERLSRSYMHEPIEKLVAPGADEKPTVANVEQFYLSVPQWDKHRLLRMLLERENPDLAIVFCKTKHGAQKLGKKLESEGIVCREIHGNLAQNKRDRVMKSFRGGKFDVLVATDLASRGIDVAGISHIINYDIPEDPEIYVHRVGRTARMGAAGKAFTFVTPEQGDELTRIESLINMIITQAKVDGFEPRPTPSNWTEQAPGEPSRQGPAPEISPSPAASAPVTLTHRPRTLGSKLPITRRHKRRR